uniref:Protein kinase domain-containing protein n=1 Tax=Chromera velia CCMP2878 TaxID=1169474 RepID=A0A0G4GWM9_9ALVE|eukprot:Cvel_5299.t1-p1 / transcript=Cvel_5299.t1 / gene=Cvel_5299 / organism=Chromera_velia_CCMP2878 / gene_product=Serine/threonine-protein kinase EDR1, putative / transcript_product=Serine/threonine-protein kinase EDR1, putative / location=Cvel_scaffold245:52607-62556(-) / protein_length=2812 / sequence_SO=supercontig / SO=protein_coding / is_pseudo=false
MGQAHIGRTVEVQSFSSNEKLRVRTKAAVQQTEHEVVFKTLHCSSERLFALHVISLSNETPTKTSQSSITGGDIHGDVELAAKVLATPGSWLVNVFQRLGGSRGSGQADLRRLLGARLGTSPDLQGPLRRLEVAAALAQQQQLHDGVARPVGFSFDSSGSGGRLRLLLLLEWCGDVTLAEYIEARARVLSLSNVSGPGGETEGGSGGETPNSLRGGDRVSVGGRGGRGSPEKRRRSSSSSSVSVTLSVAPKAEGSFVSVCQSGGSLDVGGGELRNSLKGAVRSLDGPLGPGGRSTSFLGEFEVLTIFRGLSHTVAYLHTLHPVSVFLRAMDPEWIRLGTEREKERVERGTSGGGFVFAHLPRCVAVPTVPSGGVAGGVCGDELEGVGGEGGGGSPLSALRAACEASDVRGLGGILFFLCFRQRVDTRTPLQSVEIPPTSPYPPGLHVLLRTLLCFKGAPHSISKKQQRGGSRNSLGDDDPPSFVASRVVPMVDALLELSRRKAQSSLKTALSQRHHQQKAIKKGGGKQREIDLEANFANIPKNSSQQPTTSLNKAAPPPPSRPTPPTFSTPPPVDQKQTHERVPTPPTASASPKRDSDSKHEETEGDQKEEVGAWDVGRPPPPRPLYVSASLSDAASSSSSSSPSSPQPSSFRTRADGPMHPQSRRALTPPARLLCSQAPAGTETRAPARGDGGPGVPSPHRPGSSLTLPSGFAHPPKGVGDRRAPLLPEQGGGTPSWRGLPISMRRRRQKGRGRSGRKKAGARRRWSSLSAPLGSQQQDSLTAPLSLFSSERNPGGPAYSASPPVFFPSAPPTSLEVPRKGGAHRKTPPFPMSQGQRDSLNSDPAPGMFVTPPQKAQVSFLLYASASGERKDLQTCSEEKCAPASNSTFFVSHPDASLRDDPCRRDPIAGKARVTPSTLYCGSDGDGSTAMASTPLRSSIPPQKTVSGPAPIFSVEEPHRGQGRLCLSADGRVGGVKLYGSAPANVTHAERGADLGISGTVRGDCTAVPCSGEDVFTARLEGDRGRAGGSERSEETAEKEKAVLLECAPRRFRPSRPREPATPSSAAGSGEDSILMDSLDAVFSKALAHRDSVSSRFIEYTQAGVGVGVGLAEKGSPSFASPSCPSMSSVSAESGSGSDGDGESESSDVPSSPRDLVEEVLEGLDLPFEAFEETGQSTAGVSDPPTVVRGDKGEECRPAPVLSFMRVCVGGEEREGRERGTGRVKKTDSRERGDGGNEPEIRRSLSSPPGSSCFSPAMHAEGSVGSGEEGETASSHPKKRMDSTSRKSTNRRATSPHLHREKAASHPHRARTETHAVSASPPNLSRPSDVSPSAQLQALEWDLRAFRRPGGGAEANKERKARRIGRAAERQGSDFRGKGDSSENEGENVGGDEKKWTGKDKGEDGKTKMESALDSIATSQERKEAQQTSDRPLSAEGGKEKAKKENNVHQNRSCQPVSQPNRFIPVCKAALGPLSLLVPSFAGPLPIPPNLSEESRSNPMRRLQEDEEEEAREEPYPVASLPELFPEEDADTSSARETKEEKEIEGVKHDNASPNEEEEGGDEASPPRLPPPRSAGGPLLYGSKATPPARFTPLYASLGTAAVSRCNSKQPSREPENGEEAPDEEELHGQTHHLTGEAENGKERSTVRCLNPHPPPPPSPSGAGSTPFRSQSKSRDRDQTSPLFSTPSHPQSPLFRARSQSRVTASGATSRAASLPPVSRHIRPSRPPTASRTLSRPISGNAMALSAQNSLVGPEASEPLLVPKLPCRLLQQDHLPLMDAQQHEEEGSSPTPQSRPSNSKPDSGGGKSEEADAQEACPSLETAPFPVPQSPSPSHTEQSPEPHKASLPPVLPLPLSLPDLPAALQPPPILALSGPTPPALPCPDDTEDQDATPLLLQAKKTSKKAAAPVQPAGPAFPFPAPSAVVVASLDLEEEEEEEGMGEITRENVQKETEVGEPGEVGKVPEETDGAGDGQGGDGSLPARRRSLMSVLERDFSRLCPLQAKAKAAQRRKERKRERTREEDGLDEKGEQGVPEEAKTVNEEESGPSRQPVEAGEKPRAPDVSSTPPKRETEKASSIPLSASLPPQDPLTEGSTTPPVPGDSTVPHFPSVETEAEPQEDPKTDLPKPVHAPLWQQPLTPTEPHDAKPERSQGTPPGGSHAPPKGVPVPGVRPCPAQSGVFVDTPFGRVFRQIPTPPARTGNAQGEVPPSPPRKVTPPPPEDPPSWVQFMHHGGPVGGCTLGASPTTAGEVPGGGRGLQRAREYHEGGRTGVSPRERQAARGVNPFSYCDPTPKAAQQQSGDGGSPPQAGAQEDGRTSKIRERIAPNASLSPARCPVPLQRDKKQGGAEIQEGSAAFLQQQKKARGLAHVFAAELPPASAPVPVRPLEGPPGRPMVDFPLKGEGRSPSPSPLAFAHAKGARGGMDALREKQKEKEKEGGGKARDREGRMAAQRDTPGSATVSEWEVDPREIRLGDILGSGATADVFKAKWRGSAVAVKRLRGEIFGADRGGSGRGGGLPPEFQRELAVMLRLRHPNLVLFMGAITRCRPLCLVTEFCRGGTLFDLLHSPSNRALVKSAGHGGLSWKQRLKIGLDVARAMNFLHTCRPPIAHRDLKSLNVLLAEPVRVSDEMPQAKVSDFGLSRFRSNAAAAYASNAIQRHRQGLGEAVSGGTGGGAAESLTTSGAGTFHWMAPEVLSGRPYSEKVDVFSFGVVLFELCSSALPYEELRDERGRPLEGPAVGVAVLRGRRPDLSRLLGGCPRRLRQLMQQCWATAPTERPSFEEVIEVLSAVAEDQAQGGGQIPNLPRHHLI